MKILSTADRSAIVDALKNGKVVLLPTDTVYGLATSPIRPEGIEKIYRMKERPENFNLPIMVAKTEDLVELGLDVNRQALALLNSPYIPGAISLILGFRDAPRPTWLEGRDEVAVRIPDSDFLLSILAEIGPLLVTSANKHRSNINMGIISEILADLDEKPDIVVDHGPLSDTASTILNCRYAEISVQREGQIKFEQLRKYLNHE